MTIKKLLVILILLNQLWGCSSNRILNRPDVKNTPSNIATIADDYQNSQDEQVNLKGDIETLRNLYKNALSSINSGDIQKSQELLSILYYTPNISNILQYTPHPQYHRKSSS